MKVGTGGRLILNHLPWNVRLGRINLLQADPVWTVDTLLVTTDQARLCARAVWRPHCTASLTRNGSANLAIAPSRPLWASTTCANSADDSIIRSTIALA